LRKLRRFSGLSCTACGWLGRLGPEVGVTTGGDFLWLSAPKPIVPLGTPFNPDLQSWIRNDGTGGLAPDWERIGTDATNQGPFNASFSLNGTVIPEPT
jgi:hypothetical protein